ncbi:hypothetical protein G7Z17_g7788 [Cylindrodendrum hubeiense]|uniref:NmrA-like domain-containing protein n=1 Tax=Cylindrodendrum hubeiense TaxID=595255 RepID=A0A9P5HCJ4_9HYPO|nr:hypothetical protein G7Z17_g7788 [Cylindrodendrum hubeiense]
MRVAIAGGGSMAKYFSEEFLKSGHEVIILTRSKKAFFDKDGISQRITDYSVPSLTNHLQDCDVLVSAILDYSMEFARVNLALLEACKQSPKCKRFIPSEYGGNVEDYPDQPGFYFPNHNPVREALLNQSEIEWTVVSCGWLSDWLVPSKNRHFADIGDAYPININTRTATIPGTGKEILALTSARDVAKSVSALLEAPKWSPYVYMEGEATSWLKIVELLKERTPDFSFKLLSLQNMIDVVIEGKSDEEVISAQYGIFSASGAGYFDPQKVADDRSKYFKNIHFRSIREILAEVDKKPDVIV